MNRNAFLIWRLTGAVVGAVTWPFLLPLGTAGVPVSRWLAYGSWSAVLGWLAWATMGFLVEGSLAAGAGRVLTLIYAFAVELLGFLLLLFIKVPVFDEPWSLFDPGLVAYPLAFGAAAIRIGTLAVREDLRHWRLLPRGRTGGVRLLLSVSLLLAAFLLTGWLVKTFYWDLLQAGRPH